MPGRRGTGRIVSARDIAGVVACRGVAACGMPLRSSRGRGQAQCVYQMKITTNNKPIVIPAHMLPPPCLDILSFLPSFLSVLDSAAFLRFCRRLRRCATSKNRLSIPCGLPGGQARQGALLHGGNHASENRQYRLSFGRLPKAFRAATPIGARPYHHVGENVVAIPSIRRIQIQRERGPRQGCDRFFRCEQTSALNKKSPARPLGFPINPESNLLCGRALIRVRFDRRRSRRNRGNGFRLFGCLGRRIARSICHGTASPYT